METLANPHRPIGLPVTIDAPEPAADPAIPAALLARCPAYRATPLRAAIELAGELGIGALYLKDERGRFGLGSFKALGAAYVIARDAADRVDRPGAPAPPERLAQALAGETYVCASAGNHGISLAAGARLFGARAVVHLPQGTPAHFARRLRALGADIVAGAGDYEACMDAARADADAHGWRLLADASWPGYVERPYRVMQGYLTMGAELAEALAEPPTHVVLQAGVGGLAAAMAAFVRACWGEAPRIVVVEPQAAPALTGSIRAGRPVTAAGPASAMARLDCKAPSHIALAALARSADCFVTVTDAEAAAGRRLLARHGMATTASGAAGVAALANAWTHPNLALDAHSRVIALVTEAPG